MTRPRSAGDRIVQQFVLFAGVGYVFFLALSVPSIIDTADIMAPWWTPVSITLVFGTGIAALVLAVARVDTPVLRRAVSISTAGYVAAVALWPLAWTGELVDSQAIWLQTMVGVPALIAAAAAWRPVWPFVYLGSLVVAVNLINYAVRLPAYDDSLLVDTAWTFAFCLAPVGAAVMGIRSARLLDETRDSALDSAAEAAAVRARATERTRLDALTHDDVMTTLLSAARQGRTPAVVRQAEVTLGEMKRLADGDTGPEHISADATLARLRYALADVDPGLRPRSVVDTSVCDARFPVDMVTTVGAAAAEAVRNSRRHAGEGSRRTVEITLTATTLTIVIADDGCGFDTRAVPPHRLGLAVSIESRMRNLIGGSSTIDAEPGRGTTIVLRWSRP